MRFIPAVSLVQIQLQPPYLARWSRGLRHRPFTAVTRVRIPSGSPNKKHLPNRVGVFYFATLTSGRTRRVRRSSPNAASGVWDCEVSSKAKFSVTPAVFENLPTESTPSIKPKVKRSGSEYPVHKPKGRWSGSEYPAHKPKG